MPNQSMALSQEQQLRQVLAPQMRQSLEMLQAPLLDLREIIRTELEQNPTLEEVPAAEEAPPVEIQPPVAEVQPQENGKLNFREEFDILARLDDEWREYFFQEHDAQPYTAEAAERRQFFFDSIVQNTSLQEHLMQQLALSELGELDRRVGELLVGSINEDGYLTASLEEIAASTSVDAEHIQTVLAVLQEFDPPGVGARDLPDCLRLQLERLGHGDSLAARIVASHLERLGTKKYAEIARALKVTVEEVQAAAALVATLNPKPGRAYSAESSPYIAPEIIIKKLGADYVVILNDDRLPRIRVSRQYRQLMNDAHTTDEVRQYITDKMRAGAFLLKSIQQRQMTIYRIANEIVRFQKEFLDHGVTHLKPLVMSDVARVVGLHETTVSRAVAGKYMQTPRGVFEMKYFFTPGMKTDDGTVLSNKTVQDLVGSLIAGEDRGHPLSDLEITDLLRKRGIQIARRTVAKYRIAQRLPPSHQRKQG